MRILELGINRHVYITLVLIKHYTKFTENMVTVILTPKVWTQTKMVPTT